MDIEQNLKKLYRQAKWARQTYRAVKESKKCALSPSYYPELQRKSENERIKENREWAQKYGEPNKFYNLYGLDLVGGNSADEYMDYWHFMTSRDEANRIGKVDSQVVLLRDKYLFYKYMKSQNLPVPEVFAIYKDGILYDDDELREITWAALEDRNDYFVKAIDGECASYVKHINNYEQLLVEKRIFAHGAYIFQERVHQSAGMNVLNPSAINTYRIVTINKNGVPYVLTSLLRVGTEKTGNVDNWAAGGLAIGLQENGFLKKYGYYKPVFGLKTDIHPDTNVVFEQFKAPGYQEALNLACDAHKAFYGVRAIGWDIAISESGPVFIEGNDNWEISLNQATDRPLRKDWEEAIR